MAKTGKHSEKTLERQLQDLVKDRGGLCLKLLPFQFTGLPDRMVLLPHGTVVFCETKSTGDNPSPRQKLVHRKLRELGFKVLIINEPNKLNELWLK